MTKNSIKISNEIKNALNNKKPIVALESTLISHGLPYPTNIEIAKKSIDNIYAAGSIPATIGIIDGNIKVGLSNEDIKILATNKKVYDLYIIPERTKDIEFTLKNLLNAE